MRKLFLPFALTFFAVINQSYAGIVNVQDAQNVALNFFKITTSNPASHTPIAATLKYTQTNAANSVNFYVFDISPMKGFVIVAANDNVIPILGYSTESGFNANFRKTGVANWANKTTTNIDLALQNNALADERINKQWAAYRQGQNLGVEKNIIVGPLCTTTWDQENDINNPPPFLYNLYCPYNVADTQRCLTGCVATAQAQVMKYWNYPAQGMGSYSYNDAVSNNYSFNYGIQSSNFAAHTYQWSLMTPVLTGEEPGAQDSAVALLMYDCAVSVGMDFGDDNQDGSAAFAVLSEVLPDSDCSQYALVKYFSYNPDSIRGILESSYSSSSWTNLMKNELNLGRPILYGGEDATAGGHEWVCDGYDANNNLHMNWGWGGLDNGFFAINNLTTTGTGTFNPVLNDDAVIGIVPKYPKAPISNFTASFSTTCSGDVKFTDLSQYLPTTYQWSFGDGGEITGVSNPEYSYTANGNYTVTFTAGNSAGSTSATMSITVDIPLAPTASNVSGIGPQSFSLSANTSNPVAWYNSNHVWVSNANPFITPILNDTTVYYVEDSIISASAHVGPLKKQIGVGAYSPDPYALQFNVLHPCIIQSVYVYAKYAANRTIQVLDSTGHVIAQTTVYCPKDSSRITLNLNLNAGGPYYMQIADTLGLFRNSNGAHYPYHDSQGLVNITGNTSFDLTNYYYFYDWIVKAPDCVSPRSRVTAYVTTTPTGISTLKDDFSFSMFPNPASNEVVLQTNITGTEIIWYVKNILGQTVISKPGDAGETHIKLDNLTNGVYLVELHFGEKSVVKKLVVNR